MGLTKQYLRYVAAGSFNIICSSCCNVANVSLNGVSGRYVAAAACEHVIIWDLRLGEKAQVLLGEKHEVTRICSTGNQVAVGYLDGNIQIFDLLTGDVACVFAGHKSAITALIYDEDGHKLFSGSKDTEVIVWDVVAETGYARLSGHKGVITSLCYMESRNTVISSSKDTFVKFWDLETKHCFKTLSGHRSEVWACVLVKSGKYLVTGCVDQALKVWKLKWKDGEDELLDKTKALAISQLEDSEEIVEESVLQCHLMGTLLRGGRGRVVSLQTDADSSVLACHGTDSVLEIFTFCSDIEAAARMRKRIKKEKKKIPTEEEMKLEEDDMINQKHFESLVLSDEVRRIPSLKLSNKIKGMDIVTGVGGEIRVAVSLANNTLELHSVRMVKNETEFDCLRQISSHGHQTEVRCVAFSSDNLAIASGSTDSVKLWNRPSQVCLRTVETGPVVSLCFVPGDRHLLAGTQDGRILIIDIAAGDILEQISGHTAEVWTVTLLPDQHGCVSGSSDKTVKVWNFELIPDASGDTKARVLSLLHKRTLQLEESVLCVRVSPNSKFIAVGLLDSTVKIFFMDSFKFYLSLYGHKLPVLCLDISCDSTLIATGSADRNVKIWGMDFGDCHKSVFAHDDSVTSLQFIPKTHYFFTSGKDGKVKQWDGDTYDKINTLQGHMGESRCLSVAPSGLWAVSCGADRVLRLWERTDEPLVLGDLDEEAEEELVTGEKAPLPGVPNLNMPSKKTVGSERAADSILECLDVCEEFRSKQAETRGSIQLPVLMQAFDCTTPEDFFLKTIQRIRASDLEESLLILPFKSVGEIIQILPVLLRRNDNCELICKLTIFLIKVHHAAIVASHDLLKDIVVINGLVMKRMTEFRDMVGYNLHALQWHQRDVENSQKEALFKDATKDRKNKNKKRKAKENLKRSLIVLR